MAAIAGFSAAVYAARATTTETNMATTNVAGLVYRITDHTDRLLDPTVAVVVKDDGGTVSAGDIDRIDYFSGVVEFASGYSVTGAITIDADVITLEAVAEAREFTFSSDRDVIDKTVFGDESREYLAGLGDVSGTIGHLDAVEEVDSVTFLGALQEGDDLVIKIYLDSDDTNGDMLAARCKILNDTTDVSVEDLVTASFAWQATSTTSVEGYDATFHEGPQT